MARKSRACLYGSGIFAVAAERVIGQQLHHGGPVGLNRVAERDYRRGAGGRNATTLSTRADHRNWSMAAADAT